MIQFEVYIWRLFLCYDICIDLLSFHILFWYLIRPRNSILAKKFRKIFLITYQAWECYDWNKISTMSTVWAKDDNISLSCLSLGDIMTTQYINHMITIKLVVKTTCLERSPCDPRPLWFNAALCYIYCVFAPVCKDHLPYKTTFIWQLRSSYKGFTVCT